MLTSDLWLCISRSVGGLGVYLGGSIHTAAGSCGTSGAPLTKRSGWACVSPLQDRLAFGQDGGCSPMMHVGRGQQGQTGVVMLLAAPLEEVFTPLAGIRQRAETVRVSRTVLERAELRLRVRVIIRKRAVGCATFGHPSQPTVGPGLAIIECRDRHATSVGPPQCLACGTSQRTSSSASSADSR